MLVCSSNLTLKLWNIPERWIHKKSPFLIGFCFPSSSSIMEKTSSQFDRSKRSQSFRNLYLQSKDYRSKKSMECHQGSSEWQNLCESSGQIGRSLRKESQGRKAMMSSKQSTARRSRTSRKVVIMLVKSTKSNWTTENESATAVAHRHFNASVNILILRKEEAVSTHSRPAITAST